MNDPLKREYTIPSGCPKDIELMSIWSQALEDYLPELTTVQFRAAAIWFKSFVDAKMDDIEL